MPQSEAKLFLCPIIPFFYIIGKEMRGEPSFAYSLLSFSSIVLFLPFPAYYSLQHILVLGIYTRTYVQTCIRNRFHDHPGVTNHII